MTPRVVAARWVLGGRAPLRPPLLAERGEGGGEGYVLPDGAVALDGDAILAVGPRAEVEARFGPGERLDAVLLPALVNAHLHLELSHLAGAVAGGEGLAPWIQLLVAARAGTREGDPERAMSMAAEDLARAGVAAVGDVSNTLASAAPLAGAGLAGTIFHEVFGVTGPRLEAARAAARAARARLGAPPPGLRVVESPHAVYSTLPAALPELLRARPGSIHLAEDPAERELCAAGTGPFARMRRALGGDAPPPRARSAVALVADDLAPHHLAVHCVDVDGEDLALLARSGATAVLCPRSNRFVGGALPPLPRLLAAGIPLAVGTDSLASSPSLDPLAELRVLREAFPEIAPATLLALAWNGACVGAPHVGRLSAGAAPGVLAAPLGGAEVRDPLAWLLDGFEGRFAWIARQRPGAEHPSPRPSPRPEGGEREKAVS